MTDQFEASSPSPTAALLPAGRQLRNAREALDLTPEQVALQLKLSVRQVNAIEQEAFDELPSKLFIRGFVRNYARLVKIDAEPLLAYLSDVMPAEQAQTTLLDASIASGITLPRATNNQRRVSPTWIMILLGLILGAAAVFWFLKQPTSPELALPEVDTPPVVDLPVASAVVEVTPVPVEASAASRVVVVASASSASSASRVAVTASAPVVAASAVVALSTDAIKVTSSTDSWVQIVDANGNKVLSEIIRPGTERTIDGKPPFAVKVGNAPKTQLYFHGQSVDLSSYLKPGSDVVNLELK